MNIGPHWIRIGIDLLKHMPESNETAILTIVGNAILKKFDQDAANEWHKGFIYVFLREKENENKSIRQNKRDSNFSYVFISSNSSRTNHTLSSRRKQLLCSF